MTLCPHLFGRGQDGPFYGRFYQSYLVRIAAERSGPVRRRIGSAGRQLLIRHTTGEDRCGLGHPPRDWRNMAQHDLGISAVITRQRHSCGHQRPIKPLPRPNFVRGIGQAFGRNHNPRDQLVGRKDVFALIDRSRFAEELGHGNLPRF